MFGKIHILKDFQKTQKEVSLIELEMSEIQHNNFEYYEQQKSNLNFSLEALHNFTKGDDKTKTEILKELSSNLILMDKKLDITVKYPLLEVKRKYSQTD